MKRQGERKNLHIAIYQVDKPDNEKTKKQRYVGHFDELPSLKNSIYKQYIVNKLSYYSH